MAFLYDFYIFCREKFWLLDSMEIGMYMGLHCGLKSEKSAIWESCMHCLPQRKSGFFSNRVVPLPKRGLLSFFLLKLISDFSLFETKKGDADYFIFRAHCEMYKMFTYSKILHTFCSYLFPINDNNRSGFFRSQK